tara:strand:+ start:2342 stop:2536 length:195 start_codon:yes stop_codon:yes gene_type:complete
MATVKYSQYLDYLEEDDYDILSQEFTNEHLNVQIFDEEEAIRVFNENLQDLMDSEEMDTDNRYS